MKCPKCGYDNPPNTVFCEECDWRLDQKVDATDKKRNPMMFAGISLVLGIIACAAYFIDQSIVAVLVGAVGMVLGGYSVNLPRLLDDSNKTVCMVLSVIGLFASIIGFLFGFVGLLG